MEFLLFGSMVWFWIAIGILVISFVVSDLSENGFIASCFFAVFTAMYMYNSSIPSFITWINVIGYVSIGMVYAVIRIIFLGVNSSENYNGINTLVDEQRQAIINSLLRRVSSNIIRWILLWIVSLPLFILDKFFPLLGEFITKKFKGFFTFLLKIGLK